MREDDTRYEKTRYSIGELADLGGVSRRTVRYYVQRGLLEAPTGLGRGRHYTQRHLDALIRVRKLQEAGHGLAEIASHLARPAAGADRPQAARAPEAEVPERRQTEPRFSSWTRVEIADGVELHLRDLRLDSRQVRSVSDALREIIRQGGRR